MRLAYTRPDGGVSIVNAASKKDLERVLGEMTDEEYRKHVIERSIPADALNVKELPDDWTPPDTDRSFRDAWRLNGGNVLVDMPEARKIHRDKLREMRKPKLDELDRKWNKAIGSKQQKEADDIEAVRQALRDVTQAPAIDAAKTPEELRAAVPAVLQG